VGSAKNVKQKRLFLSLSGAEFYDAIGRRGTTVFYLFETKMRSDRGICNSDSKSDVLIKKWNAFAS